MIWQKSKTLRKWVDFILRKNSAFFHFFSKHLFDLKIKVLTFYGTVCNISHHQQTDSGTSTTQRNPEGVSGGSSFWLHQTGFCCFGITRGAKTDCERASFFCFIAKPQGGGGVGSSSFV